MGSAASEHFRVRQAITQGLFALMERKAFCDISITEIVSTAQVARASFYRNFDSKEAVIDYFIDELHQQIITTAQPSLWREYPYENFIPMLEHVYSYLLTQRKPILTLYNRGFSSRLQSIADIYIEELAGDMHHNSAHKYLLYCFSGATMNMLIHWLQDGTEESAHELALASANFFFQAFQLYRVAPADSSGAR